MTPEELAEMAIKNANNTHIPNLTPDKLKFKGKRIGENTGEEHIDWAYGSLVEELKTGKMFICDLSHFDKDTKLIDVLDEVVPETVGQFTGLKDINRKEIYEGDIINCQWNIDKGIPGRVVKWITECLSLSQIATFALFDTTGGFTYFDGGNLKNTNIVQGNIYENPELAELFK